MEQQICFIHSSIKTRIETKGLVIHSDIKIRVLYIVPLKQGLKLFLAIQYQQAWLCFIHSSIKTRIETPPQKQRRRGLSRFYT